MRVQRVLVATLIAGLCLAAGAAGQDKKRESQLRTVRGVVVDKEENNLPGGVVYLKNVKTQAVKTYIAEEEGQYRFSGLDPNVDYQIHAEHQGMTSTKRTVSSFDSRKDIVVNLKVDKKKE